MTMPDSIVLVETETVVPGTNAGMMIFAVSPGASTAGHAHESDELWIVRSGEGYVEIEGHRTRLTASDAPLSIPARVFHRVFAAAQDDLVVLSLWWKSAS
jgi:quercetin dioxygenase-like cupin family protein